MALLLVIEEDGDDVIVRKIPRNGRENAEYAARLANIPGRYVTGMQIESDEATERLTIHVMLAKKLIVAGGRN